MEEHHQALMDKQNGALALNLNETHTPHCDQNPRVWTMKDLFCQLSE